MVDVKFITNNGIKSAKKAARHEMGGFLELVYFKEDVLKKYESHKDFKIGDNGTVLFGNKWGLFRGVYRVAKGYIAANLGDLGEGLPTKELEHWKKYNVKPSSIRKEERYFDFRDTIKRMIHFMNLSNQRIGNHIRKFYFDINIQNTDLFDLKDVENILNHLKKVINNKTTLDEFQSRIIFLNILLIESINTELIIKIFNRIDARLCYSYETLGLKEISDKYLCKGIPKELKSNLNKHIQPVRSLGLLKKFLLLLKVHHDILTYFKIRKLADFKQNKKKIYQKISEEFINYYNYAMYKKNFTNKEYFLQNERKINEDTSFLKTLLKFRNASAAHGFNKGEYRNVLKSLGLGPNLKDYSIIYEKLISRVSYDIEHIYFNLISPDPPIIDYEQKYLEDSLSELDKSSNRYESIFEEIASYLADFPELINRIEKEIRRIYAKKKTDKEFIVRLGCFIESISYSIKDKSQDFIDLVLVGYEHEKALSIAHISHILKNSETISKKSLDQITALIKRALTKDKDVLNVDFCAQHVIFCLIERFSRKLDKEEIRQLLVGRKIHFDLIKKYLG